MKPKATGPRPSDLVHIPHPAEELSTAMRVMDHVQSGLRQLAFGLGHVLRPEQRTPEVEAHLASLHEDEARYHEREAAWLKGQRIIDVKSSSVSGGVSEARPSRGKSSGSTRRKGGRRSSASPAPGPAAG